MAARTAASINGGTGWLPSAQALTTKFPAHARQHSIMIEKSSGFTTLVYLSTKVLQAWIKAAEDRRSGPKGMGPPLAQGVVKVGALCPKQL